MIRKGRFGEILFFSLQKVCADNTEKKEFFLYFQIQFIASLVYSF